LEYALSSGEIALIRDSELRTLLASWPSKVEDLADLENLITKLVFDQMLPWIRERTTVPSGFGETGMPDSLKKTDYELLVNSPVIENFIREEIAWSIIIHKRMAQLETTISQIEVRIKYSVESIE